MSQYTSRIDRSTIQWDYRAFAYSGDIVHDTVALANWSGGYLHLLRSALYVPTEEAVDFALAADATTFPFGTYISIDVDVEAILVRVTVYVPPLFVGLILHTPLTPVQAYSRHENAGGFLPANRLAPRSTYATLCGKSVTLRADSPHGPATRRRFFQQNHRLLIRECLGLESFFSRAQSTLIGHSAVDGPGGQSRPPSGEIKHGSR